MALDVSACVRGDGGLAARRADRRARFLQTIATGLGTHLPDNLDHLFHPWGVELPDPARVGERISEQLDLVERCDVLWDGIGDDSSRELMLRFFAFRALGPAHIRLQLEPLEYRRTVQSLATASLREPMVIPLAGMPMEWQLHHYDLSAVGVPIQVIGSPLSIASTLAFSQYAYRDATVAARPQPEDVALDVGGCWGETALWLAHAVGSQGFVHTFEPAPANRGILDANLRLNRALASRIALWDDPLCAEAGRQVWMSASVGAGTAIESGPSADRPMVELVSESIDNIRASGRILEVGFLKLDVEGAELDVLHGAAETIKEDRPRLAIACYHRPEDLIAIPEFIASLGVEYRWYLQCSTMTDVDTVAFAVPV